MKKRIRIFRNIDDMTFNCDSNIIFITGLSGSGKSFLSRKISEEKSAKVFQVEWLIHYKHCDLQFKDFLDRFIDRYDIREYVNNKWNNSKYEDDNLELKKYINLLLKEFIDNYKDKGNYIVEGLQLFTLIDYMLIKDYYVIVKGTSSFNSLKNRIKRDYQKRRDYKLMLKIKWFFKVLKQSKLYQFKHRKILNRFIEKMARSN